jgi:hypothetical protein
VATCAMGTVLAPDCGAPTEQMDQCRRAYSRKCMEIVISYRRSPMVREWIKNHW